MNSGRSKAGPGSDGPAAMSEGPDPANRLRQCGPSDCSLQAQQPPWPCLGMGMGLNPREQIGTHKGASLPAGFPFWWGPCG